MFEVWKLLDRKAKTQGFGLILLSFLVSFIDVFGVASILPFFTVILNPDIIFENQYLKYFYDLAKVKNHQDFIFILGIAFLSIFVLSLFMKAIMIIKKANYLFEQEAKLSERLFSKYFHHEYEWFLSKNTAELAKMILSEVSFATNGSLKSQFLFFSQLLTIILLTILLIIVQPLFAFSVLFVFGCTYFIIHLKVKSSLRDISTSRVAANENRFRVIADAFGSLKHAKLYGLEDHFVALFSVPASIFAKKQAKTLIISNVPRYIVEGLTFGGLTAFLLIMISYGMDLQYILPPLTLYAFAGYRLVPAVQQVFSSYAQIKANAYSVERLLEINEKTEGTSYSNNGGTQVDTRNGNYEIRDLIFKYADSDSSALSGISLKIQFGQRIAVVGESGSGKSTLLDLMIGLLSPSSGKILLNNYSTNCLSSETINKIGYVPQKVFLSDQSVIENIAFASKPNISKVNDVKAAAKAAEIHEIITMLSDDYETILGENGSKISGGQAQRIGIARALYAKPDILILDEATSSIDAITEDKIYENLNSPEFRNLTIISVTHKLNLKHKFDKVIVMQDGKISDHGDPEKLVKSNLYLKSLMVKQ